MVLPVTGTAIALAYATLKEKATNVFSYTTNLQTSIANSTVTSTDVLHTLSACIDLLNFAKQIAANTALTASFDAYVQQQVGNSTLDVHAEFTASMTALSALIRAIVGDFPKDAGGHLLHLSFDANGNVVPAPLTSASLASTNTALTNWLATIS